MQKGRKHGSAHSGNELAFGEFGLQARENSWMTARQIEAARRTITHHMRRGGNIWIRVFPDKPITKKPAETRMGSGKGAPDHFVAVVKRNRIIFEVGDVAEDIAKEALRLASHKLPFETKMISKAGLETKAAEAGEEAELVTTGEV